MRAVAGALEGIGVEVVRFNFPYREIGSGRPDAMAVLKKTIADAAERVRGAKRLVIGGRSMGGRAASMLAADGFACDGLLLLAYPLHPAGNPDKLRSEHLPKIKVPVLCINGTRDSLNELKAIAAGIVDVALPIGERESTSFTWPGFDGEICWNRIGRRVRLVAVVDEVDGNEGLIVGHENQVHLVKRAEHATIRAEISDNLRDHRIRICKERAARDVFVPGTVAWKNLHS